MSTCQIRFEELRATGKLPSPTGAALRIMELSQQEHASIVDIATILKSDPALAGKVLRVVNSAQTGLTKPTADIPHAVSLLGLRTVRRLVLGFSIVANCPRGVCNGFDFDEFWRNSLASALASQAVCNATEIVNPEEAYCFGLLSQIGRLALATVHPERYSRLLQEGFGATVLAQAEQEEFGIDHNQLTSALMADWRLPEIAVEAVLNIDEADTEDLAGDPAAVNLSYVLSFAATMADAWFAESEQREELIPKLFETGKRFEFGPDDVRRIADEAIVDWPEWCTLLEINSPSIVSLDTSIHRLTESGSSETPLPSEDTLRILVVDDDEMSLRYLERHLSTAGHELATARSGAEALRLMLEFTPQVVITDWMMPEMDGLQLCHTIRQTDIGRQMYIIMVTNHDDRGRLTEAFAAGCDDFLTKPLHPQELCARIRAASRVIQLQAELSRENSEVQQHVAELSIGNRQLQRQASTDALTGLPNRRFARTSLAESWDASVRVGCPLACLMLDIDHFKRINDTYGHPAGDLVLQQTSAALQKSLRRGDVLCRFGGEEFLVICPGADANGARCAANRLRENIEANVIDFDLFAGNVTVSIGVAIRTEQMPNVEAMLKSADDALYEAKRAGRNCVCLARESAIEEQTCV